MLADVHGECPPSNDVAARLAVAYLSDPRRSRRARETEGTESRPSASGRENGRSASAPKPGVMALRAKARFQSLVHGLSAGRLYAEGAHLEENLLRKLSLHRCNLRG